MEKNKTKKNIEMNVIKSKKCMKIKFIQPEDKDIYDDMLDEYYYYINERGNKVYDLGFVIEGKKIYKAYYEDERNEM
jgi:hypothetical protein